MPIKDNPSNRTSSSTYSDEKASHAKYLEADPFGAPLWYSLLNNVHLHWEIHSKGPKPKCSKKPPHVIEEWEEHCYYSAYNYKYCPPNQSEEVELVGMEARDWNFNFFVHKITIWESTSYVSLNESIEGLAVNLKPKPVRRFPGLESPKAAYPKHPQSM
ncbi:hypothetical protein CR513_58089, partial [Mucuna pruriens]